jgi:hypothetical protein
MTKRDFVDQLTVGHVHEHQGRPLLWHIHRFERDVAGAVRWQDQRVSLEGKIARSVVYRYFDADILARRPTVGSREPALQGELIVLADDMTERLRSVELRPVSSYGQKLVTA